MMSKYCDYIQDVMSRHMPNETKRTMLRNFAKHNIRYADQVSNAVMQLEVYDLRQQKRDKRIQQNASIRAGKVPLESLAPSTYVTINKRRGGYCV